MTESRSEKLMQMQMVPSYCGSLGHWSMERRRIESKKSSSLALRLGKPNFCFLNPPPTSLLTVWLSIFSENMFIRFFSISSPAPFLQLFSFRVSCWHLALPGGGKVEEADPDLLDRHRAKKSAVDSKPVSGSCARWWLPGVQRYEQVAVGLGCIMILRMLFQRRSNT